MKQINNQDNIKFLSEALLTPFYKVQEIKTISLETFKVMRKGFVFEDELDIAPLESLSNFELDIESIDWDSYEDHIEFLKDLDGKELEGCDAFIYFANAKEIEKRINQLKSSNQ